MFRWLVGKGRQVYKPETCLEEGGGKAFDFSCYK
jgi:hypothetical protein